MVTALFGTDLRLAALPLHLRFHVPFHMEYCGCGLGFPLGIAIPGSRLRYGTSILANGYRTFWNRMGPALAPCIPGLNIEGGGLS